MFKRLGLVMVVLFLLPTLALAQNAPSGVAALARYFPANTVVFAAVRTDDDFLKMLDNLSQPAVQMAQAAGQPILSFSQSLNVLLGDMNTNFDEVMAWLGDGAAIGMTPEALASGADMPLKGVYAVVQVTDAAGATAFMKAALPTFYTAQKEGDYTVFSNGTAPTTSATVAINANLMTIYVGNGSIPLPDKGAGLDASADFQAAVGALSAGQYFSVLYADPSAVAQHIPLGGGDGEMTLDTAPLAVGLSIQDGHSFILDTAQLPVKGAAFGAPEAVSPDFAGFIPGNASGLIHATDFTALYNSVIGLADRMNTDSQSPLPSAQIEQVFKAIGIDLQTDLLSWTTGDYGLFYRADIVDLVASAMSSSTPDLQGLGGKIDFGLVIEATDAAKAEALAARLGALVKGMLNGQQGITVQDDTIGRVKVTSLRLSVPVDATNNFDTDIVIGATKDVFFLATRPAAETIINGDGTLSGNPGYIEAQRGLLPNPTFVWYADGEGFLVGTGILTVIPLALLGPAVGNIYANIINNLDEGMPGSFSTPTPVPTQPPPFVDSAALIAQLEAGIKSISSSSISSTVTKDGITLVRFVITSAH